MQALVFATTRSEGAFALWASPVKLVSDLNAHMTVLLEGLV